MKHIEFATSSDETHWFTADRTEVRHWSMILKQLRDEAPCFADDSKFYEWLKVTWGCTVLFSEENYVTHISGIDIDDPYYTMLLLRFPL